MKRCGLCASLIIAAIAVFTIAGRDRTSAETQAVAQPADKGGAKWEYATITLSPNGKLLAYLKPNEEIRAETWQDLAPKMKAPFNNTGPSYPDLRVAVLNHLGGQGWELVAHSIVPQPAVPGAAGHYELYTFKRRVS